MAVQAAQDAGLTAACHIEGGLDAWKKACGPAGALTEDAWDERPSTYSMTSSARRPSRNCPDFE